MMRSPMPGWRMMAERVGFEPTVPETGTTVFEFVLPVPPLPAVTLHALGHCRLPVVCRLLQDTGGWLRLSLQKAVKWRSKAGVVSFASLPALVVGCWELSG